jgi:polar amino acid transport system ATP-binding protein
LGFPPTFWTFDGFPEHPAREGITMIVVAHEIGFAREVGDQLVFMDDGVVVESGPPREVLANPRQERTQALLSKVL